jgi:hypothetical protein
MPRQEKEKKNKYTFLYISLSPLYATQDKQIKDKEGFFFFYFNKLEQYN